MNVLLKTIKEECQSARFIEWLHILLFVDDMVLLATSTQNMCDKLRKMQNYYWEYGMRVNNEKTTFFVIKHDDGRAETFLMGDLLVEHCTSYMDLGVTFYMLRFCVVCGKDTCQEQIMSCDETCILYKEK